MYKNGQYERTMEIKLENIIHVCLRRFYFVESKGYLNILISADTTLVGWMSECFTRSRRRDTSGTVQQEGQPESRR